MRRKKTNQLVRGGSSDQVAYEATDRVTTKATFAKSSREETSAGKQYAINLGEEQERRANVPSH